MGLPRFHVELPLADGLETALPAAAARHVQVLRLQPGAALALFDGQGMDWQAELLHTAKRGEVMVRVGSASRVDRELPLVATLAFGMPANERMDGVVEKATELGVAAIQPLVCERSVLRLNAERAERKLTHWRGVAVAAAEQCGRARLPRLHPVQNLDDWLATPACAAPASRFVLSLAEGALPLAQALCPALRSASALLFLSGPEGGLAPAEEAAARRGGFVPVTLGPRVLRADTAPLAALAALAALCA